MTTVAALIEDTRAHLQGAQKPQLNRLNGNVTATATTVTCEFPTDHIARGSVICIGDELCYVWSISSLTLTVQRGYMGTTATTHNNGALIDCNPRFATPHIRAALQTEIRSWAPRLYRPRELTLNGYSGVRTYDLATLPTDVLHLVRVRRAAYSGGEAPVSLKYRFERNYAAYASGQALILEQDLTEATALSVVYAVPFDVSVFTDATDLTNSTGIAMPYSMLDIAALGAAWRLLSTREIGRTNYDAAAEPRNAQDVPAFHMLQTARQLKALRDERIGEEGRLLQHRLGIPTR